MTPVYLFTCANEKEDPIRWHLFQAVLHRWIQEPGVDVTIVAPFMVTRNWDWKPIVPLLNVGSDRRSFFGSGMLEVDRLAPSGWICAADDAMPLGPQFTKGLKSMAEASQDFDILGTRFIADRSNGEGIYSVQEPGNPMFVRKGCIPASFRGLQNRDFALFAAKEGLRMGTIGWLANNHIGYKLSTCWPDDYASGVTQF